MKTLSTPFKVRASGESCQPIELYDLYLDDTTLHLVNYDKNISFYDVDGNVQTYTAVSVGRETYERTVENPINSIALGIANVDRSMSAYLASHEFRGRRVIIRKAFADNLTSSGDVAVIFDGVMDTPAASEQTVQINAVDRIGTLKRECPRRWYQLMCNNKFFDEQCSYGKSSGDIYATQNYSCFSGCTNTAVKSTSLIQADNYWKNGEILITSGQNGRKKRKIVLSNQASTIVNLDISLPFTPASGDTFTISRGCDKTRLQCSGDFNNDANFSGYPTIPQEMIMR